MQHSYYLCNMKGNANEKYYILGLRSESPELISAKKINPSGINSAVVRYRRQFYTLADTFTTHRQMAGV